MQPYYNTPAGPPGMMGMNNMSMNQMGMGGMGGGGMGMMNPMQQQMGMGQMGGMGIGMGQNMGPGMGQGMMGQNYGSAWKNLGYDYHLPELGYTPNSSWGAWDLANARYTGSRLDRGFLDNITITDLTPHRHFCIRIFFNTRQMSEDAARNAHRRVYFGGEGEDAGNKTLGGAAAYNAWLIWDRDHHSLYHQYPTQENCQRLIGLACAELAGLWDRVNPRSSRANWDDATQYAAATAKYLYERHYDLPTGGIGGMFRSSRYSGYGADEDSDSGSEGHRMRRRSHHGRYSMGGSGMHMPMNAMGMGGGMNGMGMMPPPGGGMSQPGYGAVGMPGAMAGNMMGGGMGQMGQMGPMGNMGHIGMNPMMGGMGMGMSPMMMQGQGGMNPMMMQGGYGNPNNEAQAGPGMHPYHFGAQSGVAYGNQPIDQMGNPTFPGGPGRTWYAYGQPRQF